jgi:hypothetical protein
LGSATAAIAMSTAQRQARVAALASRRDLPPARVTGAQSVRAAHNQWHSRPALLELDSDHKQEEHRTPGQTGTRDCLFQLSGAPARLISPGPAEVRPPRVAQPAAHMSRSYVLRELDTDYEQAEHRIPEQAESRIPEQNGTRDYLFQLSGAPAHLISPGSAEVRSPRVAHSQWHSCPAHTYCLNSTLSTRKRDATQRAA